MKLKRAGIRALTAIVFSMVSLSATATTIDAFDRGWYRENRTAGTVDSYPTDLNYLVGWGTVPASSGGWITGEYRNYFAFDLNAYKGQTFSTATLSLYNPKVGDPYNPYSEGGFVRTGINVVAYETYQIYQVETDADSLLSGTAGAAGFFDLGHGTVLGSYNANASDNGDFIQITLNDLGLKALNHASGGVFVVGGAVSTLKGDTGSQFVFKHTNSDLLSDTQLTVASAVPEPGSLALLSLGLLGLGLGRRNKVRSQ